LGVNTRILHTVVVGLAMVAAGLLTAIIVLELKC
jgi:hypothetical protein